MPMRPIRRRLGLLLHVRAVVVRAGPVVRRPTVQAGAMVEATAAGGYVRQDDGRRV